MLFSLMISVFITPVAQANDDGWISDSQWLETNGTWRLSALNSLISSSCTPGKAIVFPQVIHGVHKIYVNNELVIQTGDETFSKTASFYARPSLSCDYLKKDSIIKWEVVTYSKFFARITHFPKIEDSSVASRNYFFDVLLNVMSSFSLFIISLFGLFLFWGKIGNKYSLNLLVGGLSYSIYSFMVVADVFHLNISMLLAHKIADVFVWLGSASFFYYLMKVGYVKRKIYYLFIASVFIGILIIAFGATADVVQAGTLVPVLFASIVLSFYVFYAFRRGISYGTEKNVIWAGIFATIFAITIINDFLHVIGFVDTSMIAPLGFISGYFFAAAIVNQMIEKVYIENDILHAEARERSIAIQVAHDIRSPISILNLLKSDMKNGLDQERNELFNHAITRISDICEDLLKKSRKTSKTKYDLNSALAQILEEKKYEYKHLTNIQFKLDLDKSSARAALSEEDLKRVVSNLINNSVAAVEKNESGIITVSCRIYSDEAQIQVLDNGIGIPADIVSRIGKVGYSFNKADGNGLGLHHAISVVESVKGRFEIVSKEDQGTIVNLVIPRTS